MADKSPSEKQMISSDAVATPPSDWDVFGPPPLISGEDRAHYEALAARVTGAVRPADFLEEMWVRDIVDLQWEVLRWRRMKANILNNEERRRVRIMLLPALGEADAESFAANLHRPQIRQKLSERLKAAGSTTDSIMAEALVARLEQIERIDSLAASSEARRHSAIREIDRRRQAFATALRREIDAVDAEYTEVPSEDNENARLQ